MVVKFNLKMILFYFVDYEFNLFVEKSNFEKDFVVGPPFYLFFFESQFSEEDVSQKRNVEKVKKGKKNRLKMQQARSLNSWKKLERTKIFRYNNLLFFLVNQSILLFFSSKFKLLFLIRAVPWVYLQFGLLFTILILAVFFMISILIHNFLIIIHFQTQFLPQAVKKVNCNKFKIV